MTSNPHPSLRVLAIAAVWLIGAPVALFVATIGGIILGGLSAASWFFGVLLGLACIAGLVGLSSWLWRNVAR